MVKKGIVTIFSCYYMYSIVLFTLSDGEQDKTVSVLLDGEESMLSFQEPTEDQVIKLLTL